MSPLKAVEETSQVTVTKPVISKSEIKSVGKHELHLHLGGAWPLDYLQEIADASDFTQLVHYLELITKGIDYHEGFKVFGLISKIVNTDQKVEDGVVALAKQMADDGVVRAEIRTGLKDLGHGVEGYLSAVLKGMKRGAEAHGVQLELALSLRRDSNTEISERTVDLAIEYFGKGVTGLDLSGDSTVGDGKAALQALKRAKEKGISITVHMGESPKESPEQQLLEVMTLSPDRIGHAVFLSSQVMDWVKYKKIPVEMCLTSALKVQMTEKVENHPGLQLLREGHPVAICTDDPLVFGVSLTDECWNAASLMGWSKSEFIDYESSLETLFFS